MQKFRDLILWLGTREDTPIGERLNSRLLSETIISGFLPGRDAIVEIVLAVEDGVMLKVCFDFYFIFLFSHFSELFLKGFDLWLSQKLL